jgi:hypothetical protein
LEPSPPAQAKAKAKERKRGWMWIFLSVNPDDICVSIADSVPLTHSRRRPTIFRSLISRARVSVIYALVPQRKFIIANDHAK